MKVVMWAVAALALGSFGCRDTDEVALNARLFDAQSMESAGGGCTLYVLGSGERVESTLGNVDRSGLVVRERLVDDEVVIDVERGTTALATKRYGVSFFASGRVDEFTVMADLTSGVFFRYWGTLHPNGPDDCAPLEDDGPR